MKQCLQKFFCVINLCGCHHSGEFAIRAWDLLWQFLGNWDVALGSFKGIVVAELRHQELDLGHGQRGWIWVSPWGEARMELRWEKPKDGEKRENKKELLGDFDGICNPQLPVLSGTARCVIPKHRALWNLWFLLFGSVLATAGGAVWCHRVTNAGKDLQDHPVQALSNPCSKAPHLLILVTPWARLNPSSVKRFS